MSAAATTTHRCTCYSVREFTGGHFGSLADLGVLCAPCETEIADAEESYRREALTPAERAREDVTNRWLRACRRLRDIGRRPGAPEDHRIPF